MSFDSKHLVTLRELNSVGKTTDEATYWLLHRSKAK